MYHLSEDIIPLTLHVPLPAVKILFYGLDVFVISLLQTVTYHARDIHSKNTKVRLHFIIVGKIRTFIGFHHCFVDRKQHVL